jgi:hypothetical protein
VIDGDYLPVEWTVLLVSLLSAAAFVIAMRLAPIRCGQRAKSHAVRDSFAAGRNNPKQQRVAGDPVLAR